MINLALAKMISKSPHGDLTLRFEGEEFTFNHEKPINLPTKYASVALGGSSLEITFEEKDRDYLLNLEGAGLRNIRAVLGMLSASSEELTIKLLGKKKSIKPKKTVKKTS